MVAEREVTFHLEEYRQIRVEVVALLARLDTLLQYAMIVAASVYAWLLVQSFGLLSADVTCLRLPLTVANFGLVIPPVFIALAGALALATFLRILQMGKYLRQLEQLLGRPSLGWEQARRATPTTVITVIVWIALLGASCLASTRMLEESARASHHLSCPPTSK